MALTAQSPFRPQGEQIQRNCSVESTADFDRVPKFPENNNERILYKRTSTEALMLAIQFGILHSIAKISPKPKRDLLLKDFFTLETISFPHQGSESTPGHKYKDFKFKSYSPDAFRHLRDHFNIQPQDFIASVCYSALNQLGNPGASGSLFYLTEDDKYIIKTVSYKEAIFLQKLLAGYWINLQQNAQTLLPQFYGLYSYQCGGRKIRFVIMNNLLPSNIKYHYKFDLKGSTYGRRASPREKRKSSPTFKDLDFLEMFVPGLKLSPQVYTQLINTLHRDCMVLESFDIMDYSLLLAVHNVSEEFRKNERRLNPLLENEPLDANELSASNTSISSDYSIICEPDTPVDPTPANRLSLSSYLHSMPEGGIMTTLPSGDMAVVYVGIIDILQNYRAKKKIEHAVKSIITNGETVSVHRPGFYSQRFEAFMSRYVFNSDDVTPQRQRAVSIRRSMDDLLMTIERPDTNNTRWTPPPDYTRARSASDLHKHRREPSEDDSVFDDDPIRYSHLDLDRVTPDSRSGANHPKARLSVQQTDL